MLWWDVEMRWWPDDEIRSWVEMMRWIDDKNLLLFNIQKTVFRIFASYSSSCTDIFLFASKIICLVGEPENSSVFPFRFIWPDANLESGLTKLSKLLRTAVFNKNNALWKNIYEKQLRRGPKWKNNPTNGFYFQSNLQSLNTYKINCNFF